MMMMVRYMIMKDWAVLLVVIMWIYLGSGQKSFMIMYLTIIIISILFDTIKLLSLPALDAMTPGESWGAAVWMAIFVIKFLVVGTVAAEEYLNGAKASGEAHAATNFGGKAAAKQPAYQQYD